MYIHIFFYVLHLSQYILFQNIFTVNFVLKIYFLSFLFNSLLNISNEYLYNNNYMIYIWWIQ